jgi:Gpi18-like mannosyltransferase
MVGNLRVSGGGMPPSSVVLALLAATCAAVVLGERISTTRGSAHIWKASNILLLQVAVLLWQIAGGWQYALFVPALWLFTFASLLAALLDRQSYRFTNRRVQGDSVGKCGFSGRDIARNVSPTASIRGIRGIRGSCPDTTTRVQAKQGSAAAPLPRGEGGGVKELPGEKPVTFAHMQPVPLFPLLLLLLFALLVRLPWLAAPDPVGDMELAARRMGFLHAEGLAGAYIYDGDYMPLRLYLLAGLSKLNVLFGGEFHDPLPAVTKTLIKLPGLLADLATLVVMVYFLHAKWGNQAGSSGRIQRKCFTIPLLYALSPPVWMNVAWWGQVDALLLLPLLLMVLVLDRSDGRWSWLCWGIALLIKPQAIIFAPLLYFATLRLHGARGFVPGATISTGIFSLVSLPLILAEQGPGLAQAYLGSVGRFPKLNIGAYNLWYLLTGGASGDDQQLLFGLLSYRTIGLLLMAGAALLVAAGLLRRADQQTRLLAAGVLALSFFVLPTQIHERYLFLVLVFLALCIGYHTLFVLPYSILVCSALLNILGTLDGFVPLATPFIAASPLPFLCALANILVLIALFVVLLQQVQNTGSTLSHQPVCTQSARPEQA